MHFSHVISKSPVVFQLFPTVFTRNSLSGGPVFEPYMPFRIMFVSQNFLTNKTHCPPLSLSHQSLRIT